MPLQLYAINLLLPLICPTRDMLRMINHLTESLDWILKSLPQYLESQAGELAS